MEGHNPNFGIITEIHYHIAEIFGLLVALIFLEEYCRYYFVKIEFNIQYHCDNLKVVNKVKAIQNDNYHYDRAYKTTDHDAVLELKELIPRTMMIDHVKSHAEKQKRKEQFTLPEMLNSRVDSIISEKAKKPTNNHIHLQHTKRSLCRQNCHPNNYSSTIFYWLSTSQRKNDITS